MAIDWSLAQPRTNALGAALDGYKAGRAIAQERGVQNALAGYAKDPAAAEAELMRFDPEAAIKLGQGRATQERAATTFAQGQADHAQAQKVEHIKLAGQLLQGVDTPEKWEAVKGDPQLSALIPDIAGAPWEKVAQLRQAGIALNTPQQQGFTLNPGDTRFDGSGRQIATVAAAPTKGVVLGDGGLLVDPITGKVMTNNPKNFAPPRAAAGSSGVPPLPPGFVIEK